MHGSTTPLPALYSEQFDYVFVAAWQHCQEVVKTSVKLLDIYILSRCK